jgi:hypothetical protein
MHHKAYLVVGTATGKPYHLQCTCGTAGDFKVEAEARAYLNKHFSRIGPTETSELVVPGAEKGAAAAPQKQAAASKPAPPPAPAAPKGAEGKK